MTRFIMSLEEAVDLVLFAFENASSGDILVQKAPACTIQVQAEAVCELFGGNKENIRWFSFTEGIFYRSVYVVQEWLCRLEHLKNLIHIQIRVIINA